LHDIHYRAWKKGIKGMYYVRSKSMQRAESMTSAKNLNAKEGTDPQEAPFNNQECLACQ
jgi:ribonucleoside-diphosphate reductase alpha chain